MDLLSDCLRVIRPRGSLLARAELTAPWGLELPPAPVAYFHIVVQGTCGIWREAEESPVWLQPGDMAVLPDGPPHVLRDAAGSPIEPCPSIANADSGCPKLAIEGGGEKTVLICGRFHVKRPEVQPLFSLLPSILRLPAGEEPVERWLRATLSLVADETDEERPGHDVLLDRILEILCIQMIRAFVDTASEHQTGWLAGMGDPLVAEALEQIHATPQRHATLSELAAHVGVSRSVLAARFKAIVGESPIAYAARWRMQLAIELLDVERMTVANVASHLGFDVEATFSRSFKRIVGVAPSQYRSTSTAVKDRTTGSAL